MFCVSLRLIPQAASGLQREGDPLLRFLFATEREEGFALEVEQILLANRSAAA